MTTTTSVKIQLFYIWMMLHTIATSSPKASLIPYSQIDVSLTMDHSLGFFLNIIISCINFCTVSFLMAEIILFMPGRPLFLAQ